MGIDAQLFVRAGRMVEQAEVESMDRDLTGVLGPNPFYSPSSHLWACQLKDETILEVHVDRYYSEGYPRGYLPYYLAVASWLRDRLPGARVYYDDSDEEEAEELTDARAESLWAHWVSGGWEAHKFHHPSPPGESPWKATP
jgi:hypothetical protein